MDSNLGLLGAFVKRSCLSHVGTFNHKYPLHSCQKHFKILGGVLVFKLLLWRGTQKLCPLVTILFYYLTPGLWYIIYINYSCFEKTTLHPVSWGFIQSSDVLSEVSKLFAQNWSRARITARDPIHRLPVGDSSHIWLKNLAISLDLLIV